MKATRIAHQVLIAHCPVPDRGAFMPPCRYYLGADYQPKTV
jgi:hypothetical protein